MLKFIDGVLDRLFAIAGAFLFSQGPAFIQQYTQRLAGHAAELGLQISKFNKLAESSGGSLKSYILKLNTAPNPDFVGLGKIISEMVERQTALSAAYQALHEANLFSRPLAFFGHLKTDIFWGTWADFSPALSLNLEGILYALAGALFGCGIYWGIRRLSLVLAGKLSRHQQG